MFNLFKGLYESFLNFIGHLLLIFGGMILFTTPVQAKICVLSFFENNSNYSLKVDEVFKNYKSADVYTEAKVSDILNCFHSPQYQEVVWLAHGTVTVSKAQYSTPLIQVRLKNGSLTKLPLDIISFKNILQQIQQMDISHLKKVRVSVCGMDYTGATIRSPDLNTIESSMDILLKYLHQKGIYVELSPKQEFASNILDQNVTELKRWWMAKSIPYADRFKFKAWRTEKNTYCQEDWWGGCDRTKMQYVVPTNE
ncbi:MAG: hypothetical protein ACOYOK_13410 [Pseudobdellovibrionaceae bacterium]